MSVPSVIFIDTSILDHQAYNFSSSAIEAFLKVTADMKITLLLPDPTEREIRRHIEELWRGAIKAMDVARRKAPFLAKWKEWPKKNDKDDYGLIWTLRSIAEGEWKAFLNHFKVKRIAYDGVDLKEVMDWYDKNQAPFGPGKKRKEFPDALALASVLAFAKKENTAVAILSEDNDFKDACSLHTQVLHYGSLPSITEAIIARDKRVSVVKTILQSNTELISAALIEEFMSLDFYPEADSSGEVQDVEVDNVEFQELLVVGIGDHECTVAFEARMDYSAHVSYIDSDTAIVDTSEDIFMPRRRLKGGVSDWNEISGIVKLELNKDWTSFEAVTLLKIDDTEICVTTVPDNYEYL